uniref:Uncharacterized protein n=1 Tax=Romanomermis culicivorax TaxID=13658 RepID=A0A915IAT9_ROMCU
MELLVDGVPAAEVYEEPEILDDWPMHHVKDLKNRMVVGACWQGSQGKMTQHFKGYLSALTLSPFKQENPSVVQCLLQCKERLEFFGLNKLKVGEEAVFNRDMTELTLKARNAIDFSQMLSKVSYVNSRPNPTVGDRFARIIATSRCLTSSGELAN